MKKVFQLIIVSSVAFGAFAAHATESGVVIGRADRSASVKRGDVVSAGSTISVVNGSVRGSVFPGADFALSGSDAAMKVDNVTVNAQGGFITQQSASLTLEGGDLVSTISRQNGVVTGYNVTVGHGTASVELTQHNAVAHGMGVTHDNFAAACYKGVLYFTFDHGIPLPGKETGTKEGEPQHIVAIPAGQVLIYNEYLANGQVSAINALKGTPFNALAGPNDEFQSGPIVPNPDDEIPPGTISPSR